MWAQIASALLGIWLMAAPALLGYHDPARTNDYIVGPLAASIGFIAVWEVTRALRWANLVLGIWLVIAPWVLGYDPGTTVHSTIAGLLLIALAWVRGPMTRQYGGGWRSLLPRRSPAQESPQAGNDQ